MKGEALRITLNLFFIPFKKILQNKKKNKLNFTSNIHYKVFLKLLLQFELAVFRIFESSITNMNSNRKDEKKMDNFKSREFFDKVT